MRDSRLVVRARRDADLEALVRLLAQTHRDDGYPGDVAYVRADFIASPGPGEIGAWVAEQGNVVVGHVALLPPKGVSLPLWRAATGRDDHEMAAVSRLFSRARGAGGALLTAAVQSARESGLAPVLEVERDSDAYGFYLHRGWTAVGEVKQPWRQPFATVIPMVLSASGDPA